MDFFSFSLIFFFFRAYGTPLQYSSLENPLDTGAWWAAVHGVVKSRTRLSDFTFTFYFPALEKEMGTHSSVLAWRIPGTGSLVGCRLWGHTQSDTTEATSQQQPVVKHFGAVVKNLPGKCRCKRHGINPWIRKIPWSRKWQPTLVFLPGKFHGQRSLVGYSLWGCKYSDVTEHACTPPP